MNDKTEHSLARNSGFKLQSWRLTPLQGLETGPTPAALAIFHPLTP